VLHGHVGSHWGGKRWKGETKYCSLFGGGEEGDNKSSLERVDWAALANPGSNGGGNWGFFGTRRKSKNSATIPGVRRSMHRGKRGRTALSTGGFGWCGGGGGKRKKKKGVCLH